MEKIRPLGTTDANWVLLQPDQEDTTSKGGLWIAPPKDKKDKSYRGRILAVGPGKVLENGRRVEPGVRVGEYVIFREYNLLQGVERSSDLAGRGLIPEEDIMAVIDGEM